MSAKDGSSAFPQIQTDAQVNRDGIEYGETYSFGGMSLRDWFAGQVIGAVYAQAMVIGCESQDTIIQEAYEIADGMIQERAK